MQRGIATELTVRGSALAGHPTLVAPFRFAAEAWRPGESNAATFKTRVTADPATPIGIYPVRVLTDDGLSAPFPLAIGQLPQVQEKEPNDNINWQDEELLWTAQRITLPTVVEGELGKGDHQDCFRFGGKRGQRIFARVLGAAIGSVIDGHTILVDLERDFNKSTEPRDGDPSDPPLFATLPHDGDFLFVVSRGGSQPTKRGRSFYRLTIGTLPVAEIYPLGGRRGETVRVELRNGTLDAPMFVPVALTPAPGESVVRVRAPTVVRGPGGLPLDVETLPPLIVGDLPEVLEPVDPAAPPPKAKPPIVLNGRIDNRPDRPSDEDRFTLIVSPGQRLRAQIASRSLGSALYPSIEVHDTFGKVLDARSVFAAYVRKDQRDVAQFIVPARGGIPEHVTYDSTVEFTVPAGQTEVTLTVSGHWSDDDRRPSKSPTLDYGGWGHAYRVTVLPVTPSFSIELDDAQVSVPRRGVAAVGVTVTRDGYDGPIVLRVADPPVGLTVRPGAIAAGQNVGAFTLEAAPDATFGPLVLNVIGEGRGPDGPIVVHASKAIFFGPPTTEPYKVEADTNFFIHFPAYLRSRVTTQNGLFAVATKPLPLRFDAPAGPVEVRRGSGTTFKIKVDRSGVASGPLVFRPHSLPPGLTIPSIEIGGAATEAIVKVNVTREYPLGAVTIVLTGQGKVGGIERRVVVPAVTLQVIRDPKGE